MLLLSLLVETGQLPGAGLTQADKTCIQLNFYLEILKGHLGFKGGQKPPPAAPPKYNPGIRDPYICAVQESVATNRTLSSTGLLSVQ